MPARSAPRDPVPFEPAPLDAQLAGVLRATGAQAARAVDGRRALVLAEAGLAAGDDVAALVQLARGAGVVAAGKGEELDDLVVTSGRTVHVLRECDQYPGVVLHVRLDRGRGDVGAVRRALAAPTLVRAVRAMLAEPPAPPAVPAQRTGPRPVPETPPAGPPAGPDSGSEPELALPIPLPRRPSETGPVEQQPALVTLTGGYQQTRTGALAVLALPPVTKPAEPKTAREPEQVPEPSVVTLFDAETPPETIDGLSTGPMPVTPLRTLPRRMPSPLPDATPHTQAEAAPRPAVLRQSFSSDLGTMRRLLDGLRKLA